MNEALWTTRERQVKTIGERRERVNRTAVAASPAEFLVDNWAVL